MVTTSSSMNCPNCSFVGKSAQSLKVHMAIAHKRGKKAKPKAKKGGRRGRPRGVRCATCGKIIKTPAALKAHVTRMHKGKAGGTAKRGRPAKTRARRATALDRRLMRLSLAEVADLHTACRDELRRRLTELAG